MPIKPENKHRYPPDWPEIRKDILQRAGYRCEWQGCTARHHQLGYWEAKGLAHYWVPLPQALRDAGVDKPMTVASMKGPIKIVRIVLTIAHLDHLPENCHPDNLRAWCQRHHLAYDAGHHQANAYRTRKAAANTLDLFDAPDP